MKEKNILKYNIRK